MFKAIGISLLVLIGLFALGFVFQGEDFFMYKFWAPKYEQARRETFEQTKSYTQGSIQELQNMQMEYIKGTAEQKAAMASIILHRAADFDENRLPPDLRAFIDGLKSQATGATP